MMKILVIILFSVEKNVSFQKLRQLHFGQYQTYILVFSDHSRSTDFDLFSFCKQQSQSNAETFGKSEQVAGDVTKTIELFQYWHCQFIKMVRKSFQLSLLTLDRDDFLRIFHRRDSFKVLKEYLRDVVYFRHCNFAGLEADDLSVRYYRKNMLICCEDDIPRKGKTGRPTGSDIKQPEMIAN